MSLSDASYVGDDEPERCESCGAVYRPVDCGGRPGYSVIQHAQSCPERIPAWPAHLERGRREQAPGLFAEFERLWTTDWPKPQSGSTKPSACARVPRFAAGLSTPWPTWKT